MLQTLIHATNNEGQSWLHSSDLLAKQASELPEMVDITTAQEMRLCKRCQIEKPISDFYRDVRRYICKKCMYARNLEWRANNLESVRERTKKNISKLRLKDPDAWRLRMRKWRLKQIHGITLDQFVALFESQNGKCGVCDRGLEMSVSYLAGENRDRIACLDHDHATGRVRGILCNSCNRAIGMLKEDIDILLRAASYLKEHRDG